MQVHCQCRAVHFTTPTPAPLSLYHCHCTTCRAQSASAFGTSAIFPAFPLPLDTQPIGLWSYQAPSGEMKDCYFCKVCGVRLLHASRAPGAEPLGGVDVEEGKGWKEAGMTVSVKGGCVEGLDWKRAFHIFCGEMVTNMQLPEGVDAWVGDDDVAEPNFRVDG